MEESNNEKKETIKWKKIFFSIFIAIAVIYGIFVFFITSTCDITGTYATTIDFDENTNVLMYVVLDSTNTESKTLTTYYYHLRKGLDKETMPQYFYKTEFPMQLTKWNRIVGPFWYLPEENRYKISTKIPVKLDTYKGSAIGYDQFYTELDLSDLNLEPLTQTIELKNDVLYMDSFELKEVPGIDEAYSYLLFK